MMKRGRGRRKGAGLKVSLELWAERFNFSLHPSVYFYEVFHKIMEHTHILMLRTDDLSGYEAIKA